MSIRIDINSAKANLFQLGEKAWAGEKVIITRSGKPYLELRPYTSPRHRRKPGRLAGKIHMAKDFDKTPGEIINRFEV